MSKYTTDMAAPFLDRVAARKAAVTQAELELSRTIGEGIKELGPAFAHNGQEFGIRFYKKTDSYALYEYSERLGTHLKRGAKAVDKDIAEVEDLALPKEPLIEVEFTVGEDLLNDPDYGFPNVAPNTEPSTVVI